MRELKFRIMYKRYDNIWLKNEYSLRDLIEMDGAGFLDDDDIIEQYTGLKDKNGKEIYEGDILRLTREVARDKSTLYQVVWDEPITAFNTKNLDEKRSDIGYLNETAAKKDFLVIGNIHENPELLGGENG